MSDNDNIIEQPTIRKLLWRLLPVLCLIALVNVLDRVNLPAAMPSMQPSLQLTNQQFHRATELFYFGFLAGSVPAARLIVWLGARRAMANLVTAWGLLSLANAVVWNAPSLYIVRLLLGAVESGLFPAILIYVFQWLPPQHRGKAVACLFVAIGVVPLLIAPFWDLILIVGELFDIADWRWLFCLQGFPAVALGLQVGIELPRGLTDPPWLDPSERVWLAAQLHHDAMRALTQPSTFLAGLTRRPSLMLGAMIGVAAAAGSVLGPRLAIATQAPALSPDLAPAVTVVSVVLGAIIVLSVGVGSLGQARLSMSAACGFGALAALLAAAAATPGTIFCALTLFVATVLVPGLLAVAWLLVPCFVADAALAGSFGVLSASLGLVGLAMEYFTGRIGIATGGWLLVAASLAAAALATMLNRSGTRPTAMTADSTS